MGWLVSLAKFVVTSLVSLLLLAGWAASVALPWILLQGRADLPAWVPWAVSAAVFPVLPLLWHLVGERRVRAGALLRGRDRLVLRALTVAAISTGVATLVAPAEVGAQWSRVRGVAHRVLPEPLLAWLQRTAGPRDLVEMAPSDTAWIVVAELARLEADVRLDEEGRCGVDLERAEGMIAMSDLKASEPQILFVVRAKGIGELSVLTCLWNAIPKEDVPELRFGDRDADGWHPLVFQHREQREQVDAAVRVLDENTVAIVSTPWKSAVMRAWDSGISAEDGQLASVLARIDRSTGFWGVATGEVNGVQVDVGGSIEGDENTFRWAASADSGTEELARVLEVELLDLAERVKQWALAASWVPGDRGERWTVDLAVRREGSVVYGDFVAGRSLVTQTGKTMLSSWW